MSKLPKQLSCPECKDEGKYLIHISVSKYLDDVSDKPWSWEFLNHDGTSKFKCPVSFTSSIEAKAHISSFLEED